MELNELKIGDYIRFEFHGIEYEAEITDITDDDLYPIEVPTILSDGPPNSRLPLRVNEVIMILNQPNPMEPVEKVEFF